jgi:hypothetical protein
VKARENAEAANENVFTVERRTSNVAAREVPEALYARRTRDFHFTTEART